MNRREPTKAEYSSIARGIAAGHDLIELAGRIAVDRSTLSGWMRRDGFLYEVAAALSSPDDLGADGLAYLRDEELHEGERKSAWALRMEFWEIVQDTFPHFFEHDKLDADRNRECAQADQEYTIKALAILEERGWRNGTADEQAKGLTTARKRKKYRLQHGLKWDWKDGLWCYFDERWDATRCAVKYADEDGMDDEEQRLRYGYSMRDGEDRPQMDVIDTNTRPLEVKRDPRLPTKPDEAEALLRKIERGADFMEVYGHK